jgi:NAD+ diphosphatase
VPGRDLSIDRVTRSQRNTFTSVRLDRLAEKRDDASWVEAAMWSPTTRFLPLWRNRNLLQASEGRTRPVYLSAGDLPQNTVRSATLLGSGRDHVYFGLSVDGELAESILQSYPGAGFRDLRLASVELDERQAGILAYAKALLYWQHRHAYCGVCGARNRLESAGHRCVCGNAECARESFPRIDPAIIVLATHGDACLLGHNASWPERRFSALAGFVEPGESLEDAVAREVYEESRVRLGAIHYVSSQPWPFPSSAMCGFYAEAVDRSCAPSDEMAELRWLTARQLEGQVKQDLIRVPPPVSIAFRLIADWYARQTGGDLEALVRGAGSWLPRKGIE